MPSLMEEFKALSEKQQAFVESCVMAQIVRWSVHGGADTGHILSVAYTELRLKAPDAPAGKISSHFQAAVWSLEAKGKVWRLPLPAVTRLMPTEYTSPLKRPVSA